MVHSIRSSTPRGAHLRALFSALCAIEELLPDGPCPRRIAIRDHKAALQRAHPELKINEVELAQELAEEDGHGQDY